MAPSSSGLGRLVLSQEIRGSNPLGATNMNAAGEIRRFFYTVGLARLYQNDRPPESNIRRALFVNTFFVVEQS